MPTAKQRAYDKIRKSIFSGAFPPGFHLREEELAVICKASRTPVRQAIRLLAGEGLVTIGANKRCYVSDVDETHAEEIFDLLAFLEGYSAGLAAERASEGQVAELREVIEAQRKLVDSRPDDDRAFLELNSRFHRALHACSGNRTLNDLIARVVDFTQSLYLKLGRSTDSGPQVLQHEAIVAAIAKRDRRYAELMMRVHLESVRREFRELWLNSD